MSTHPRPKPSFSPSPDAKGPQSTSPRDEGIGTTMRLGEQIDTTAPYAPPLGQRTTPGPWWADDGAIYAQQGEMIVRVADTYNEADPIPDDEADANAALLASAPQLLASLQALTDAFPGMVRSLPYGVPMRLAEQYDQARAAIAKATGGAGASLEAHLPTPGHAGIASLVEELSALGFKQEQDSPGSGALRYDFPAPDTRYILVSNAWGGSWPTTDEEGVSAGLFNAKGVILDERGGSEDGTTLPPVSVQIKGTLEAIKTWMASK